MAHDLIRLMHALFLPAADTLRDVAWRPAVDVYRTHDGGWLVKFELAGVRPQDMSLTARGSRLLIRGVRRDCSAGLVQRCHVMEISYSPFERSVELPTTINPERVTAENHDGMLVVRIPPEETP